MANFPEGPQHGPLVSLYSTGTYPHFTALARTDRQTLRQTSLVESQSPDSVLVEGLRNEGAPPRLRSEPWQRC